MPKPLTNFAINKRQKVVTLILPTTNAAPNLSKLQFQEDFFSPHFPGFSECHSSYIRTYYSGESWKFFVSIWMQQIKRVVKQRGKRSDYNCQLSQLEGLPQMSTLWCNRKCNKPQQPPNLHCFILICQCRYVQLPVSQHCILWGLGVGVRT